MRLAGPRRFKRVFAEGVRSHSAGFTVLALGNGGSRARLGLAVARKHLRRAVDRNRVKRRVRESFRRHQRALGGLDVVVMTRASLARCQPGKIDAMLQSHWSDIVRRAARARVARSD